MDITTAIKSIGKKVVYTGKDRELIKHLGGVKCGTIRKTIDGDYVGVYNIYGSEMYFKASKLEFMEMSEFKIGDKVILRPETKPYTKKVGDDNVVCDGAVDGLVYIVNLIHEDGGIDITHNGFGHGYIQPKHLKHAKQDYNDNPYRFKYAVGSFDNPRSRLHDQIQDLQELDTNIEPLDNEELRFMIYHSNPSRTLQEMKDIEKWLLNK